MYRLIVALMLLGCLNLVAQDSTYVAQDSTHVAPDSTSKVTTPSDSEPKQTKNPTTAVLLSLPLPGLGQFYNEQYWKIPIFTGTCAVTGYLFFKYNADFNSTQALYDQAKADSLDPTIIQRLFDQKEAYRDNRDLSGVIFLTAYLVAAVDAYVGAHLYDFDVGDDLSLGIGPTRSQTLALSLRMRW